jgi:hypothetical protein
MLNEDPKRDVMEAVDALAAATDAGRCWDPHAEGALRAALTRLVATGDPNASAYGWDRLGAYFVDRGKPMPAALSYWRAYELARGANDREPENQALVGLCYALTEFHEGNAQLAVLAMLQRRDALGVLPTVADALAALALPPGAMRRLLRSVATDARCERWIGRSLRKARRSLPEFEARFLDGEVRFDAPEEIFELVRTPRRDPRHREAGAMGVAQLYAKRLRRRLATGILPLVLVAAALALGVLDPSRAIVWTVLGPILVIYLLWWGVKLRAARIWVRRSRSEAEFSRQLDEIEHESSTHAQAYAILQEFAEHRSPFALLLRGFGPEAAESVTPEKSTGMGVSSKAAAISSAIMHGSSATVAAAGYLGPSQWVITTIGQPSEVEKFLAHQAVRYIPMITVSNPVALADRTEHYLPRLELGNDDWKMVVRLLVSAARFVVVECPALTPGLTEELEIILSRQRQGDTVIVLPSAPQQSGQLPEAWTSAIRDVFDRVIESKALLVGDLTRLPVFEGLLERKERSET